MKKSATSKKWEPSTDWLQKKKEAMAAKMGHELKGYAQTHKTTLKKKYNWDKSQGYRKRTGFYRTKIDSMGHSAGYKWAVKKEIDPHEKIRKYGANSPSFDEGVHEYKMKMRAKIASKMKHK